MAYLGIDLGAHKIAITTVKKGRFELVLDETGSRSISPCVLFKNQNQYIGNAAISQSKSNISNFIRHNKTTFGLPFVENFIDDFNKQITFSAEPETSKFKAKHSNRTFSLSDVDIAAMIFDRCHKVARAFNKTSDNTNFHCHITVPSDYSMLQRDAIIKAATTAGFLAPKVIEEPVAVALAYSFFTSLPEGDEKQNIVIADFGQSALRLSLAQVNRSNANVLLTSSIGIGAGNFTRTLMRAIMQENEYDYDATDANTINLRAALANHLVKHQESLFSGESLPYSFQYRSDFLESELSSQQFLDLVQPDLDRIFAFIEDFCQHELIKTFIEGLKTSPANHSVVAFGAAIRIRPVAEKISQLLCVPQLNFPIDCSEAASAGACLASALGVLGKQIGREIKVSATNNRSIVMKWSEPGNPSKEPKKLILFKKGDTYPVSRKATLLCTSDSLEIELFYDEPTNIDKNVQIQTCIVKDLKGTVENPARLFARSLLDECGIAKIFSIEREIEKEINYEEEVTDDEQPVENVETESQAKEAASPVKNGKSQENGKKMPESPEKSKKDAQEPTENSKNSPEKEKTAPVSKKKTKKVSKTKIEKMCENVKVKNVFSVDSSHSLKALKEVQDVFRKMHEETLLKAQNKETVCNLLHQIDAMIKSPEESQFIADMNAANEIYSKYENLENVRFIGLDQAVIDEAINGLKGFFEPLQARINEYKARPEAFKQFNDSLQYIVDFVTKVVSSREVEKNKKEGSNDFSHITDEDLDSLNELVRSKSQWISDLNTTLASMPLNLDAPVKIDEIYKARGELIQAATPIMTKKPPKIENPPTPSQGTSPKENGAENKSKSAEQNGNDQDSKVSDVEVEKMEIEEEEPVAA